MQKRFRNLFWLASRDYLNEWQMSGFFVLALAAVLGPMMILFALKFGIIGSMLENLIEDPRNREIHPIGSGRYDLGWIEQLRLRPEIDFIIPHTRAIATTIELKSESANRIVQVEMLPSAEGDPMLKELPVPNGYHQIVISDSVAHKLKINAGDRINGSLARRYREQGERVHLPLEVMAVARPGSLARDGAFVSLEMVEAVEDFRDGRAVPELGWTGDDVDAEERTYPSFRLYTHSIYEVAPITRALEKLGIEVRTRAADIEMVSDMDRNLTAVFWLIAMIGLTGFSLSFAASLWANVDRKRKELSILRLVGLRTGDIVMFPVIQSLYTSLFGWLTASLIYLGVAFTINRMFADKLQTGEQVCLLLPAHFAIALGLTLAAAVIASAMAGYRAALIEPSEGLREI